MYPNAAEWHVSCSNLNPVSFMLIIIFIRIFNSRGQCLWLKMKKRK